MGANPKAAKEKARKAHTQARRADAAYKSARVQARKERRHTARKQGAAEKQARLKASRGPRIGARRVLGVAAYLVVGMFPYLASYFILPAGAVVVLMGLWAFGLVWTVRIARTAPYWTPAGAITAIGVWVVAVQGGNALFGWL